MHIIVLPSLNEQFLTCGRRPCLVSANSQHLDDWRSNDEIISKSFSEAFVNDYYNKNFLFATSEKEKYIDELKSQAEKVEKFEKVVMENWCQKF